MVAPLRRRLDSCHKGTEDTEIDRKKPGFFARCSLCLCGDIGVAVVVGVLFFPEFPPGFFRAETRRFGRGFVGIMEDLPECGATVFNDEMPAGLAAIFANVPAGKGVFVLQVEFSAALGANRVSNKTCHGDRESKF